MVISAILVKDEFPEYDNQCTKMRTHCNQRAAAIS
jgi:hypothetical protein